MRKGCFGRDDFACIPRGHKTHSIIAVGGGVTNATIEERLRNVREKMRTNLMFRSAARAARISAWETSGVDSSFIPSGRSRHKGLKRKKAQGFLVSCFPKLLSNNTSTKFSYYIEGKNPPNLTEKIRENYESVPYLWRVRKNAKCER